MPEYTYRREDGTTFTIKQKFSDSPLTIDPETGQKVWRVIQNAGIIFKGSGFYVNDSKTSKNGSNGYTSKNSASDKSTSKEATSTTTSSTSAAAAD